MPMDLLEEITTGMADVIVVNSNFTRGVFERTFTRVRTKPAIVYPCADVAKFDEMIQSLKTTKEPLLKLPNDRSFFLSINRFDPNKKITLAIEALSLLLNSMPNKNFDYQLIVAGGYDPSVSHNVNYLKELQALADRLKLSHELLSKEDRIKRWSTANIVFLTDITEIQKIQLLKTSLSILYTPSNEHFGIVPVEAMLSQCPVIAQNNGGPLESITTDTKYGILCNSDPKEFFQAMQKFANDKELAKKTGENARDRAIKNFDFKQLGIRLDEIIRGLAKPQSSKTKKEN